MPGHEEHVRARPELADAAVDLEDIHAGHDHICHQNVDWARMALSELHGALAARRDEDVVPRPLEHRLDRGANAAVVVDQKDGLRHGVIVEREAPGDNPATRPSDAPPRDERVQGIRPPADTNE